MRKAFTLVELIIVITILSILGTIGFIALQGYNTEARDTKRLSDINNLYKKINIELSKSRTLSSIINTINTGSVTINSETSVKNQGTINFDSIGENKFSFQDNGINYPISYSIGGFGTGSYKFVQLASISESKNQAIVVGNYYKFNQLDSDSIITNDNNEFVVDGGIKMPYKFGYGGNSINGVCGASNNIMTLNIPNSYLCDSGNPSIVTGNGPYNWNCIGLNGGSDSICKTKNSTLVSQSPGLLVAYGLTKLNSNYTGPAIKLRRSSDNQESDFYFNYNGVLDKNSISSWLNGSAGYVSVWYDQNINGVNLIQTDSSKQPILNADFKIETYSGRRLYSLDNSNFNIASGKAIYLKYRLTNLSGDYQAIMSTRDGETGLIFYKTPSSGNQVQSWIRNSSGWNPLNLGTATTDTSYFFMNFSSAFPRKAIYNGVELSSYSPDYIYDNNDLFIGGIGTGNGGYNTNAVYEYLVILDPSNTQNYTNFVNNVIPNL